MDKSVQELEIALIKANLRIKQLEDEVKRLNDHNTDMSWRLNPDRMGGQFSDDEINDTGWR